MKNVKGSRFLLKSSSTTGAIPTSAVTNDHTLGWLDTDIYVGELFSNVYDKTLWIRNLSGFTQFAYLNTYGKLDSSLIPTNLVGAVVYKGTWDATTSAPASGAGWYYLVNVSGTTNLDGITDWQINDWAIHNGIVWEKIDNTNVTAVGSPLNNQIAVWNASKNIQGYAGLTFDGSTLNAVSNLTLSGNITLSSGTNRTISVGSNPSGNGYNLSIIGGGASTSSTAGDVYITGGATTGIGSIGGDVYIDGGNGATYGNIYINNSGNATSIYIKNLTNATQSNVVYIDGSGKLYYGATPGGSSLPSMSGHAGEYLTNDGVSTASWSPISTSLTLTGDIIGSGSGSIVTTLKTSPTITTPTITSPSISGNLSFISGVARTISISTPALTNGNNLTIKPSDANSTFTGGSLYLYGGSSLGGIGGGAGSVYIDAGNPVGTTDGNIYINNLGYSGGVFIKNLTNATQSYVIYTDGANGKLYYGTTPSGGGGTINMTGDVTGSGTLPNISNMTLATGIVTPGTYNNVTVNTKGLTTGGSNVAYAIPASGSYTWTQAQTFSASSIFSSNLQITGNLGIGVAADTNIGLLLKSATTSTANEFIRVWNTTTTTTDAYSYIQLLAGASTSQLGTIEYLGTEYTTTPAYTSSLRIVSSGTKGMIFQSTDVNGSMRWDTGGSSEQMKMDNTGNLGINRVGFSLTHLLEVGGTVYSTGDITSAGTVIALSDSRLKTNIKPIESPLDKILNLTGVNYNRIDDNRYSMGLIAQEVEKIIPEVVFTDSDGYKGISYQNLTAILIEGIKELKKQIDSK